MDDTQNPGVQPTDTGAPAQDPSVVPPATPDPVQSPADPAVSPAPEAPAEGGGDVPAPADPAVSPAPEAPAEGGNLPAGDDTPTPGSEVPPAQPL